MNAIYTIAPYKWNGLWVFDDPDKDLKREAFVSGADEIVEVLAHSAKISRPGRGFLLLFSATPFPSHQIELRWIPPKDKHDFGNNYRCQEFGLDGWLCPALYRYFNRAPKRIYAEARSKTTTRKNHEQKN